MTAPLVFLDTETTGLALDDDIWELAAIRRNPGGDDYELHMFIQHDTNKCARLPESFFTDHLRRFPAHDRAWTRRTAAAAINAFLEPHPKHGPVHIVGAVPNFDTERISLLLRAELGERIRDPWHYHLIDVENLAIGALVATPPRIVLGFDGTADDTEHAALAANGRLMTVPAGGPETVRADFGPPWDSDEISRALGVEPPVDERHTAMGDARWARAIYDAVMGTRPA
ncbi:hypothetical protein [Isoptericola sp. QY 916]|uniref:hypothetical protein n=1 Tax=Isoptericola sp. QY 916 TaxID=2782570 RepID=UPI003D300019|nr:hypothetical protein [Isoptericola sp. QY 916]